MIVHEVKPLRLIQSLCAVCGSNLAVFNPAVYSFCCVPPCVADVGVDCAVCHQSNKRRLLLLLLLLFQIGLYHYVRPGSGCAKFGGNRFSRYASAHA